MEQQRQYGIPASVTLAQMAFESDWGRSYLARKGNNYFGIKCSPQWLAEGRPYSLHNDDKPDEKFCNYATVEESIDHHSRLLMSDRYKRCEGRRLRHCQGLCPALRTDYPQIPALSL